MRSSLAVLLVCLLVLVAPAMAEVHVPVDEALESVRPWLRHEDWTVRSMGAHELRQRADLGTVHLLTRMLAAERHRYAAGCALAALRGRPRTDLVMEGGPELVDALLRWATHTHPAVRQWAREILVVIPPVRRGDKLAHYEGWWKRGRTALAREQQTLLKAVQNAKREVPQGPSSSEPPAPEEDFYVRLERMARHGLQLCIVMDDTGSMGPWIGAATRGAVRLVARLKRYVPKFQAGLITYKDSAYKRTRQGMTENDKELEKAFRKIAASGGGDWEEGVDKGIRMAMAQDMGWGRKAHRVIVVIGDAPPHESDMPGLLRSIRSQREDPDYLYEYPIEIHTISAGGVVDRFPEIARLGGGTHLHLKQTGQLVDALVLLTFGGKHRDKVKAWMTQIDALAKRDPVVKKR